MKIVAPAVGVIFGVMAFVFLFMLVKSGELVFLAVAIAAAGASYVFFKFWRDERLDEEDEKHDRIRGESRV
ncbi:MAG TPA: hypothetical protein VNM40_00345 [Candidatus Paceibacterota bacterium]|nr:hypothetical protein [Candidatus Paceibacterota bacterium]